MIEAIFGALGLGLVAVVAITILIFLLLLNIRDALDIAAKLAGTLLQIVMLPKTQSQNLNYGADILLTLIAIFVIPQLFGPEHPWQALIGLFIIVTGILVCVFWTKR